METWFWIAIFVTIFVAVALPIIKKTSNDSPRKKDVVF